MPVIVENPGGSSPFLLLGDHAGREIPKSLGDLGLAPESMELHIAWDIGVEGMGRGLAERLDACFIRQRYSRLVIDCNRKPDAADLMPRVSDGVPIPGNAHADVEERLAAIWRPYHHAIGAALDRRRELGLETALVSLHSFTPQMDGISRPWRYGVLHRQDSSLSSRTLALLQAEFGEEAGDNRPYALDAKDNTVPLHADPRRLDYLELEVRQDLIAGPEGQAEAAAFIARLLSA
jgi:predicted N-formylglutamate amidohydrolase